MEAIKRTLSDGIAYMEIIGVLGAIIIVILVVFSADKDIVTGEGFKVHSDTSKYSCIVSEIENDLLFNCLKVK